MNDIISVIGAGNGGTAIAAYLASQGAIVNLCDLFPEYLEGPIKDGGITLTLNQTTTRQTLNLITENLAQAIEGASLIMVVTPSFTHKMIAKVCAKALEDDQIILLNPGRTGGALEFLHTVRSYGCRRRIVVSEAQTLIYSCRKTGESSVEIYGVKKEVEFGTLPSGRAGEVLDAIHPYYPQFKPAKNCLQTSLSNIGALFHPAPILLNAGRVEDETSDFKYYWDGISPSVAELIGCMDEERIAVAKAYGVHILSAGEWLKRSYDTKGDSLYQLIQNNRAYRDIKAPHTLRSRYLMEDVPMSLVPIAELGKLAGVPTPNIDAVITLASSVCHSDFRSCGRSLKNLGLEGMTPEQVIDYFESGIRKEADYE